MTEIMGESHVYQSTDRSWLAWDVKEARISGLLNFALFTAGTHFPNGYLPAGLCLGRVTATGRLGPYSEAAGDGRATHVGLLFNDVKVPAVISPVSVPLVAAFAVVITAKLPAGNGLDTAGRADLPLISFR